MPEKGTPVEAARIFLAEGWAGIPATRICEAVLDLIERESPEEIGYRDFARAIGLDGIDSEVITAAAILTSVRAGVLEPGLRYKDDEGKMHEVPEGCRGDYATGMPDPASGRPVENPDTRLYPYFRVLYGSAQKLSA